MPDVNHAGDSRGGPDCRFGYRGDEVTRGFESLSGFGVNFSQVGR